MRYRKLSEKQKQKLVDALNILYPTPLCEKTVDKNDANYIMASKFIDENYAKLDESLRAFFPEFIFLMNGNIEFAPSMIADLDVFCKNNKNPKVLSFKANGKLESIKSREDFDMIMQGLQK